MFIDHLAFLWISKVGEIDSNVTFRKWVEGRVNPGLEKKFSLLELIESSLGVH